MMAYILIMFILFIKLIFSKIKISLIFMLLPPPTILHSTNPQSPSSQLKNTSLILSIQYCHNCDFHVAVAKHQESKYCHHYAQIKKYMAEHGVIVRKKAVPQGLYKKSPYCPVNVYHNENGEAVYFPQIGAFQVYYGEEKLFSKLQNNTWPVPELLLAVVQQKQRENENKQGEKEKHIREIQKENNDVAKASKEIKTIRDQDPKNSLNVRIRKPAQNKRYSLQSHKICNNSEAREVHTARLANKSCSSHRQRLSDQEKQEVEIIKMYSPAPKNPSIRSKGKTEKDSFPSIEGKAGSIKTNVYLEPVCPKSRVSLQNYQRQRFNFVKKIHDEKIAYDIEKVRKAQQMERQEVEKLKQREQKEKKWNDHMTLLRKNRKSSVEQKQIVSFTEDKAIKMKKRMLLPGKEKAQKLQVQKIKIVQSKLGQKEAQDQYSQQQFE